MLKWIRRIVVVAAMLLFIASIALWITLSIWVPTKGKALAIRELERRLPVHVAIRAVRYDLLQAFVLEEVRITDRTSSEVWFASPIVHVHVSWLPLVLQKRVAFTASASVTTPCRTTLRVSGRYHLRESSLRLDVQTTDIPLGSVAAPLTRHLPPALTTGHIQVQLSTLQSAGSPLAVSGRVTGTQLVWKNPSWQLTGDALVDGVATAPHRGQTRWSLNADARLQHGTLEGLPAVGSVTDVQGAIRISPGQIEIRNLMGNAVGSLWKLEGMVGTDSFPSVEVLISSRVNLATLIAAFPPLAAQWRPDGAADFRAVCRGFLRPNAPVDCLAHAEASHVTLGDALFNKTPLTDLSGIMDYDVFARKLSIRQLEARLRQSPLSARGEVIISRPFLLALDVTGTLPLEVVTDWLPANSPLTELGGTAGLNLHVQGFVDALTYTGNVNLREVRMKAWSKIFEGITGDVTLKPEVLSAQQVSLRLEHHPLTVTASLSPSPFGHLATPPGGSRINAIVELPEGQCELTAHLAPDDFILNDSRVQLSRSTVRLSGRISRTTERVSSLNLAGEVELSELSRLPFVALPAFEPWKLHGLADVEATFKGDVFDWTQAAIRGRVRAEALSIRTVPLQQLFCTIEQQRGVLHLRIPSAVAAGGKLQAELTVEHRGSTQHVLLQSDLIGLQLEQLVQVIPTWRSRSVTGQASAHTAFSGTWNDQATWTGEGWLNAAGERLGDVPLLDKLFRGLFGVLADRMGLDMLRRAEITQASLHWLLMDRRFRSDDLRLGGLAGAEPVAIYAKGSLGLDQTLDVVIEPELSEGVVLQAPTTSTLAGTVLKAAGQLERLRRLIGRHRITGTLGAPQYHFEFTTQEIFKQLKPSPATATDLIQNLLNATR